MDKRDSVIFIDFLRKIRINGPMNIPDVKRVNRLLSFVFSDGETRRRLERIRRLAEDEERRKGKDSTLL
jgi:hypothetical protein